MAELGIFLFECYNDVPEIRQEVEIWLNPASGYQNTENSAFSTFKHFLEVYCVEMLPENFRFDAWAGELRAEMLFACQFIVWPTQFSEPCPRKRKVKVMSPQ